MNAPLQKPLPAWVLARTKKWQRKRVKIYYRDGGVCRYCGKTLTLEQATLDHVIAKSRGGTNADENLVIACESCNVAKRDNDAEWFVRVRENMKRRESVCRAACDADAVILSVFERKAHDACIRAGHVGHALRALVDHVRRTEGSDAPAMKHALAVLKDYVDPHG